jgi:hypothetical protein
MIASLSATMSHDPKIPPHHLSPLWGKASGFGGGGSEDGYIAYFVGIKSNASKN